MVCLVTGAAGFIGSHLTRRLVREGCQVHVLVRQRSAAWRLRGIEHQIRFHQCDVLDKVDVRSSIQNINPEVVFHLAAFRSRERSVSRWNAATDVNVKGTGNLLEALSDSGAGLRLFVNTGSSEEYGCSLPPCHEGCRESPVSPYSYSKAAATYLCEMYHRMGGLPTTTMRPFVVYGPAQDRDMFIPSLIQHALDGQDFRMTTGEQCRDFVYVEDVVEAYWQASTQRDAIGHIINVGTGRGRRIIDVANLIVGIMGNPIRLCPGALPQRSGEADMYADVGKAEKVLHWSSRVSLEEGLRKTIEWYRGERASGALESLLAEGATDRV